MPSYDGTGLAWRIEVVPKNFAIKSNIYTNIESESLVPNSEYFIGEQQSLTLVFPDTAEVGDVIYINFYSGATETQLEINGSISALELTPQVNTGYEIFGKYNGQIWILGSSEYTII